LLFVAKFDTILIRNSGKGSTMANFRSLTAASAAVLCGFAAFAEDIEITVESGQTVTRSDVIAGEGEAHQEGRGYARLDCGEHLHRWHRAAGRRN